MKKILAIETSCDETAVSVVTNAQDPARRIIHQSLFSQIDLHKIYGGVVPELAARSHMQHLSYIFKDCLSNGNIKLSDIDAFAATAGPGLIGGLIVGLMSAKSLSLSCNKPFFAINHLEGHALTPRLSANIAYPYLLLLISGGHCQFVAVERLGKYKILGRTRDDAAGESFDKVAKLLDLPYPGGPSIEKIAKAGNSSHFLFPEPFKGKSHADFSFSGLKTSVRREIENQELLTDIIKANIAASFQLTVANIMVDRLRAAFNMCEYPRVVVAGGVAANQVIRAHIEKVCTQHNRDFYAPPLALCTDNAAMIGWAAMERYIAGAAPSPLNFVPRPRWALEDLD